MLWSEVEIDTEPLTPPYTYGHQCSSVLLTAYIPVLLIVFSIQLSLGMLLPVVIRVLGNCVNLDTIFRLKLVRGIMWPVYWLNRDDSAGAKENIELVGKDPSILFCPKSTYCFAVLNNLLLMLTFGLCSPVLAFAILCSVLVKLSVKVVVMSTFTKMMIGEERSEILSAFSESFLSLRKVLVHSFWVITWCSALFLALICWDLAMDEVGWVKSAWIPVMILCYPLLLGGLSRINYSSLFHGKSNEDTNSNTELTCIESIVINPVQKM